MRAFCGLCNLEVKEDLDTEKKKLETPKKDMSIPTKRVTQKKNTLKNKEMLKSFIDTDLL